MKIPKKLLFSDYLVKKGKKLSKIIFGIHYLGHGINKIQKHAQQMKGEIKPIGQVHISNNFVNTTS